MATPEKEHKAGKVYDAPIELPKCAHASTPPPPDEYGEIVEVVVGDDRLFPKETFQVFDGLLKHYSSYFRSALKEEWIGKGAKTIALPFDKPNVFRAFYNWLFARQLYSRLSDDGSIPMSVQLICEVYVFGDVRGVSELCNAAIDLLFQRNSQRWEFPEDSLAYIYDNTTHASPLRTYMVEYGVEKYDYGRSNVGIMDLPQEHLAECLLTLCKQRKQPCYLKDMAIGKYIHTKSLEICSKYHDHTGQAGSTDARLERNASA